MFAKLYENAYVSSNYQTFFLDVAVVVQHTSHAKLQAWCDRPPHRCFFTSIVESYRVLVHLFHVLRLFSTTHEFVNSFFRWVGVFPRAVLGWHVLWGILGLKVSVSAKLSQIGLESAVLLDSVSEWFLVQNFAYKLFHCCPLQILLPFVRVGNVTNLAILRKWLWCMPVVKAGDSLVWDLCRWTLYFIAPRRRDFIGFLTACDKCWGEWLCGRSHPGLVLVEMDSLSKFVLAIGQHWIGLECAEAFIGIGASRFAEAHVTDLADLVFVLAWLK